METSDVYRQEDVSLLLKYLKDMTSSIMHATEAETVGGVLERIAEASRVLVRTRYAALGIPDGKGGLEYFMFTGIEAEEAQVIGHLPHGRGLLGAIMRERQPIRVEHIANDPRSIGFPAHHPDMDRFLGVPIIVADQLFGMLYLTDRLDGKPFTEQDQWLIETLAGYAALAIAGARLRQQNHQLTLLEERERIGMELHDGVIQSLYAVGMQIQLIHATRSTAPESLIPVMQNINSVIEEIRGYIQNLKSQSFQQKTISECLHEMVSRLHIPPQIEVIVSAPAGNMPFLPTTFEALAQMANEALSNVIRHADATQIHLSAYQQNNIFTLEIGDNGRGFQADDPDRQVGLGLRNIQQRARLHGGSVIIQSQPEHGTNVLLSLPING